MWVTLFNPLITTRLFVDNIKWINTVPSVYNVDKPVEYACLHISLVDNLLDIIYFKDNF